MMTTSVGKMATSQQNIKLWKTLLKLFKGCSVPFERPRLHYDAIWAMMLVFQIKASWAQQSSHWVSEVKINYCSCQELLDSCFRVTFIFKGWYLRCLSHVPILPITGLSIWGLSSFSWIYKEYSVVDVTFPALLMGAEETLFLTWFVVKLQVPKKFQSFPMPCVERSVIPSTHAFRILPQCVGCDIPSLHRERKP